MSILKSKIKKLDNISKRLDILKESDELNNVTIEIKFRRC